MNLNLNANVKLVKASSFYIHKDINKFNLILRFQLCVVKMSGIIYEKALNKKNHIQMNLWLG